jgi:hypothetical protein
VRSSRGFDGAQNARELADGAKFLDLGMLLRTDGRERTEAEFRALLGEVGFSLTRVIPTAGLILIIESQPI